MPGASTKYSTASDIVHARNNFHLGVLLSSDLSSIGSSSRTIDDDVLHTHFNEIISRALVQLIC